jgi:hypothetical protein
MRIVKCCQSRVSNPLGGPRCSAQVVGGHHVDENPRHAEIQHLYLEERFERPTGTAHAECSSWRLNRHDARERRLVIEPLAHRFKSSRKVFNADHAASSTQRQPDPITIASY